MASGRISSYTTSNREALRRFHRFCRCNSKIERMG